MGGGARGLGDELPHIHVRNDRETAAMQDLIRARSRVLSQRTLAITFVRAYATSVAGQTRSSLPSKGRRGATCAR